MHRLYHVLLGAGIAAILAFGGAHASTVHFKLPAAIVSGTA